MCGNASRMTAPSSCCISGVFIGNALSLRLDSTLKVFAPSRASRRYSGACSAITLKSFGNTAQRCIALMPNIF